MRVNCPHCHKPALINSRREISSRQADIYCYCKNDDCAAHFVVRLQYIRTITPPISDQLNSLAEQIANLDAKTRHDILKPYGDLPLFE